MSDLFTESSALILSELRQSLARIRGEEIAELLAAIRLARRILVVGAGRMGILLSTFCMRLNHLGFSAHVVGTATCPPGGEDDLLLVASSSGETPTVREIVRKAKEYGAKIAVITAAPGSSIAAMASLVVYAQAPSSIAAFDANSDRECLPSEQPMKTLFEQTLFITLEAMVLALMRQTRQTGSDLARRHGNLE